MGHLSISAKRGPWLQHPAGASAASYRRQATNNHRPPPFHSLVRINVYYRHHGTACSPDDPSGPRAVVGLVFAVDETSMADNSTVGGFYSPLQSSWYMPSKSFMHRKKNLTSF
ncbi:DUF850 domain-containing [Alternaria alternata]|nr:DUF850 domain-containing [Alternaria alternata]